MHVHVVPPWLLLAVFGGLMILTVATVGVTRFDFGRTVNVWLALGIAVAKAGLVALFFMHLRWDRPFNAFVLICSLAFVALFITFAMTDSSEYKPEVEAYVRTLPEGISPTIKAELDKLPPPLPESELPKHE